MDQSHASGNVTWAVDEELGGRFDRELLDNSGEISANQSADDHACLLQRNTSGRGSANDRTAIECHKQHGMWCRVKAFSLTRSGRERGVVHEEQEGGVSKLTRLKRLREGHVRSDGRAFHFTNAERKLRKYASHLELQIESLNEINDGLQEDARIREANMDGLHKKIRSAERQLIASQRRSAKLNGILELAKLQGDAQQQVLDVKQDDVIKMAVKQAELYDQIRKLKLTIETLRNKLEKCEDERSGSEYQPQDETAEHPSSMPLPSSTTRAMNRMQAAVNARRAAGRQVHQTDMVPDEALDQLDNLETRRSFRRHHTLTTFTTQVSSAASRRIKHQRTINTALRANLRNRDKRIQELINEKHRTSLVLEKLRRIAKLKIDMIYKNILSLPSKLTKSSSGPMVQETIETYLEEVDRSTSIAEARRIISRLKEFGRFLRSEESFDDFLKNQETRHKENNAATIETSEQTSKRRELLENNTPRRILRRQRVNRSLLETRRRAARRMLNRSEPEVERRDCRNLPKIGKHCRCCCYEAKMKKLAASREEHPVVDTMPTISAERDAVTVSESKQEEVAVQVNGNDMNENTSKMPLEVAHVHSEVERNAGQGLTNDLETSGEMCQGDRQDGLEMPSPDKDKEANDSDDPLKSISPIDLPADLNNQTKHGPSNVPESDVGLTGNCLKITQELSPEDIEKQKDIISDLLVDKWFLEGQVKALEDNERELTVAKSEISCQLDAAHQQLARSTSDTGRLYPSHNILALEEKLNQLHRQLEEMKEKQDADEMVKSRLQCELDGCKKKVVDLEAVKKRLEGEVEGWMETVMEVRKGRINLLNHMDNITEKVGKLSLNKSSCNDNADDLSTLNQDGRRRSAMKETCECSNHDRMTVNELKADIETLAEQRKIQDSQIEQLSDLLQRANDQKQQLMNNLVDVQQERRSLQFDFDQLLARV